MFGLFRKTERKLEHSWSKWDIVFENHEINMKVDGMEQKASEPVQERVCQVCGLRERLPLTRNVFMFTAEPNCVEAVDHEGI